MLIQNSRLLLASLYFVAFLEENRKSTVALRQSIKRNVHQLFSSELFRVLFRNKPSEISIASVWYFVITYSSCSQSWRIIDEYGANYCVWMTPLFSALFVLRNWKAYLKWSALSYRVVLQQRSNKYSKFKSSEINVDVAWESEFCCKPLTRVGIFNNRKLDLVSLENCYIVSRVV